MTQKTTVLLAAVLLGLVLYTAPISAQDRNGYFNVRSATTTLNNGVRELDARLQLLLSQEANDALTSGVPLIIELDLEVIRSRRFLPDALAAELVLQYELEYRPLSQRYIVRTLNSGEQESFATLYAALNNLGRVQGLPIIDDALLDDESNYRLRPARAPEPAPVSGAAADAVFLARPVAARKRVVRMAARTIRRTIYGTVGVLGVGLALVALFMLSRTAQNSVQFDRLANAILLINIAGLLVLFLLLVGNLTRLFRDYRAHVPGSKLKARMVGMFVGLAVVPLLVVFYFSMQFINRGIDTWFNVDVEEGLDDALELSRAAFDMQMRGHLNATVQVAGRLRESSGAQMVYEVGRLQNDINAREITVFGRNSQILATSTDVAADGLPIPPSDEVIMQVRQNRPYVSLAPLDRGTYEIRTAVPLLSPRRPEIIGMVRATFPVSERIGRMADNVDSSYTEYKRLVYLREPLKRAFSLTLTIVLMISLLSSIYGALILSRRLVAPIQNLVAGTRAVAKGDFDTRLPTPSRDEIGFLISSFNDMTQRLAAARRQASQSQAQVEAEREVSPLFLQGCRRAWCHSSPICESGRRIVRREPSSMSTWKAVSVNRWRTWRKASRSSNSCSTLRACITVAAKRNGASRLCCAAMSGGES